MNTINNEDMQSDLRLYELYKVITSRLEELKQYFRYWNIIILEEYKHYYNPLLDTLYMFDIFQEEYLALFKANRIIQYILEHEKLTTELKSFISQVWTTFTKLMKFKLHMIENNRTDLKKEYDNVYFLYVGEYFEKREYFYENICNEEMGNDLFVEYCRIMD